MILIFADSCNFFYSAALEERRDPVDESKYEEAVKELNSGLLDLNRVLEG